MRPCLCAPWGLDNFGKWPKPARRALFPSLHLQRFLKARQMTCKRSQRRMSRSRLSSRGKRTVYVSSMSPEWTHFMRAA
jgi:hypothetical protein